MRIIKWLDKYFEEVILLVLLIAMVLIMGIQITARYLLASSLSWSEEITRYCFIISGFLSTSYCIKIGASVKIDQLVNVLPEKLRLVFTLVRFTIELVLFSYLIPFAWTYVKASMISGQLSPACSIPMYLIQFSTVLSFTLCVIRIIQKWIETFGNLVDYKNGEVEK